MIKKLIQSKIAKNATWLVCGRIAQMGINFFVAIYVVRFLGPSKYGLINYASAYTSFFASFCSLGINSIIVSELINNRDQEGTVLGTALLLKAVSSILSAVAIISIVSVVDKGEADTILVVVLSTIGMVLNILETFNYWFQSILKSKITAIATLTGYAVSAAYKVLLIETDKGVAAFALASALDYAFSGAVLMVVYKHLNGAPLRISRDYAISLLQRSWHFIVPSIMVSIYAQTDKLMLKQLMGETEIGYYSIATSLCTAWCFLLQAIIDSCYPSIIEAHKLRDKAGYLRKNRILYALVFYLSMIVSTIICILSKPMILFLYGDEYLPATMPLRIVTWYTAFSYLGVARNAWIVCENQQKYLAWIYLSAAVTNIVLNLFLIPRFGASGAAVASLAAQIVTTMVTPWLIVGIKPNVRLMTEAICLKGIIGKR